MLGLKVGQIDGGNTLRSATADPIEIPRKVGGSVLAPVLISSAEPSYTKEARKKRLNGSVLVGIWVGPDGVPSHLRVLRPLGYGLDEEAIKAVSRYRFESATENGQAVLVELTVEVNFAIF